MKRIALLMTSAFFALPLYAHSVSTGGGFVAPGSGANSTNQSNITTVADVKSAPNDTFAVLQGKIERKLKRGDNYLFTDSTGSITVDIDEHQWNGQIIKPTTVVEIQGKVNNHFLNSTEIEVNTISIVTP